MSAPEAVDIRRAVVPRFQNPGGCGEKELRIDCSAFVTMPSEIVSNPRNVKASKGPCLVEQTINEEGLMLGDKVKTEL